MTNKRTFSETGCRPCARVGVPKKPTKRRASALRSLRRNDGPVVSDPSPEFAVADLRAPYFPIRLLAFLSVMARVGTVTVVGTEAAQSSRIDLAIAIASGAPVG